MPAQLRAFSQARVPLWLTLLYTLFVGAVISIYWHNYGPANFLWFCDAALLITCLAMWLASPLLASMQAVAMTVPQTLWIIDFVSGGRLIHVSAYMFDPGIPLWVRGLSTFHIWLPVLLLWLVWRLGYDRRAWWAQSLLAIALLLASFMATDPRHPPTRYPAAAVNVNRVFGPGIKDVQTWMPSLLYLVIQMALYPLVISLPTHLLFLRLFRGRTFPAPVTVAEPAG